MIDASVQTAKVISATFLSFPYELYSSAFALLLTFQRNAHDTMIIFPYPSEIFPTTTNANKSREYEMAFVLPGRFALKPKICAR